MAHGTIPMYRIGTKVPRLSGGTLWQKIRRAIKAIFG